MSRTIGQRALWAIGNFDRALDHISETPEYLCGYFMTANNFKNIIWKNFVSWKTYHNYRIQSFYSFKISF